MLSTEVSKGFGYINPFAKAQLSSWTYSFNELGSLDYILLSSALADVVRQQQVWHINAAESDIAIATTGPYRSSDHDPLFVDLVR